MKPVKKPSPPTSIIDEKKLTESWQTLVSSVPFTDLKKEIKILWTRFNKERDDLPRDYMALNTIAYMASFYLPNLAKVEMLWQQKPLQSALARSFKTWGDEWTIIDFGAGPLTASIGFLKALIFLEHIKKPKRVTIVAVEPSSVIVKVGEKILRDCISSEVEIVVEHCRSLEGRKGKAHLVLAANSLNEIPIKLRSKISSGLLGVLRDDGLLLFLEPGQDVHAKALSGIRDHLLPEIKKHKRSILAPCYHHRPCPLGPTSKRLDWCWFQQQWFVPPHQTAIDVKTKINHRELNFSYMFIGPEAFRATHYARVVSDAFQVPVTKSTMMYWKHNQLRPDPKAFQKIEDQQRVTKQLLCTQDGLLTAQVSALPFSTKRGDPIATNAAGIEIKERINVAPKVADKKEEKLEWEQVPRP